VAVLIDTDLLLDMGHGVGSPEVERILGEEDCAISVITVSELLHGFHRATGARRTRRSAFVEHLLAGLPTIPITDRVARVHAGVWAELAECGQVIGAHDLLDRRNRRRARPRPGDRQCGWVQQSAWTACRRAVGLSQSNRHRTTASDVRLAR
jgi:tRNA(fMet)-specific endonuclease VapC